MGVMRLAKAGIAALALGLAALTADGSAEARDLDAIIQAKEIRLGYVHYPPLMVRDPKSGTLSGVYIEALEKIFNDLKIKPVWVEQTWGTFAAALQSEQIDVFIGASFATPQRSLALSFTRPFAFMGNGIGVRKADAEGRFKGARSLMDFDKPGIKVVTPIGGAGHDWLKAHYKNAEIIAVDAKNQSQGTLEVLSGRADAVYWDSFVLARDVAANKGQLVDLFAENPQEVNPISWSIKRKQHDLLVFLNTILEYMETNGTWLRFEEKYRSELGGYFHIKRTYFSSAGETGIGKD